VDFLKGTLARPLPAAFVEAVAKESLKVPARIWRAAFEGFLEDDVLAELHRVAAPTLGLSILQPIGALADWTVQHQKELRTIDAGQRDTAEET
jgi:hypothetical protein